MRLRIRPIKCPCCNAPLPIKKKIFRANYLTVVQCLMCGTPCAIGGDKVDDDKLVRTAETASQQFEEDIWRGLLGEKMYKEAQNNNKKPSGDFDIMPKAVKGLK